MAAPPIGAGVNWWVLALGALLLAAAPGFRRTAAHYAALEREATDAGQAIQHRIRRQTSVWLCAVLVVAAGCCLVAGLRGA